MGGDINSDEEDEEEQEEEEEEKKRIMHLRNHHIKNPGKIYLKLKICKKEKQSLKEKAQAIVEANTLKING